MSYDNEFKKRQIHYDTGIDCSLLTVLEMVALADATVNALLMSLLLVLAVILELRIVISPDSLPVPVLILLDMPRCNEPNANGLLSRSILLAVLPVRPNLGAASPTLLSSPLEAVPRIKT